MNRIRAEAGAQRGANVADLERMKRDRSKLLDALVAGVPAAQLKDRMIALDGRRRALQAELLGSPRRRSQSASTPAGPSSAGRRCVPWSKA